MDNLINKKINKLTVISLSHVNKNYRKFFLCKCECGKSVTVALDKLNSGNTKSCGCLKNKTAAQHPSWKGYGDISQSFWSKIKTHAETRNINFEITIEQAWQIFLKQESKCALTKIDLEFNHKRKSSTGTASLDRIDSSKGYVAENVQWVHKDINRMKSDFSEGYFIKMCKLVAKN